MRLALSALLLQVAMTAAAAPISPRVGIVKMEPLAASGTCTPKTDADKAQNVLKRFDIDIVNGTETNKLALSRGLLEIEKLAGGRFRPAEGAIFKILPQQGCAQQLGKTIVLRHGCGSLDSVAYYVHELGHYIGNNDRAKLYGEYKKTVTPRCAVSNYSLKDWTAARARNEEFAEVIAAFVTNPSLLLKSGPSCVKAYNFFRDHVFDKGELVGCDQNKPTAVAAKPDAKPNLDMGKLVTPKNPDLNVSAAKPAAPTAAGAAKPAATTAPVTAKPIVTPTPVVAKPAVTAAVTPTIAAPATTAVKPTAPPSSEAKPTTPATAAPAATKPTVTPKESLSISAAKAKPAVVTPPAPAAAKPAVSDKTNVQKSNIHKAAFIQNSDEAYFDNSEATVGYGI